MRWGLGPHALPGVGDALADGCQARALAEQRETVELAVQVRCDKALRRLLAGFDRALDAVEAERRTRPAADAEPPPATS